ncbi:MAG: KpsF/GutQ family sugar-phosphate isomerase [Clostridium sp.]
MDLVKIAHEVFDIEIEQLEKLKERIDCKFEDVVELIFETKGRVVFTGIGKSGIIGKKIAASFASTGTNSFFMHAAEALHGDLGMVYKDDIVIAISNSGSSQEVVDLIPSLKRIGCTIVAMTGNLKSPLAINAEYVLDIGVEKEACPMDLAPTSSTTATLLMGDALTVALIERRDFKPEKFAVYHPGGALGRRLLTRIKDLMNDEVPVVNANDHLQDIVYEIGSKRLGITLVYDNNIPIGIVTDGDIRRAIINNDDLKEIKAKDVMTEGFKTISANDMATDALEKMEEHKITSLAVVDDKEPTRIKGIITMHDLFTFID